MHAPPPAEAIRDRVLGALPVSHEVYSRVLELLDIEETRKVPSAAVTLGSRSVLRINPDFVDGYCPTDEALAMLVLHELMHVVRGHTRLFRRIGPARNIALDAVINAELCRMFRAPEYTVLFRRLYDEERLPEALLRPPRGWSSGRPEWVLTGRAGEVHRALYGGEGVTTDELLRLVEDFLLAGPGLPNALTPDDGEGAGRRRGGGPPDDEEAAGDTDGPDGAGTSPDDLLDGKPLLGSHEVANPDEAPAPEVVQEIRGIVERWVRPGSGRGAGGPLGAHRIALAPSARARAVATLRRAVLSVARRTGNPRGRRRPGEEALPALLPWRTSRDRRGLALEAAGMEPALWAGPVAVPSPEFLAGTHVYVDVSGSMADVLPLLYRALLPLVPLLAPRVFLFSTRVHEAPLAALRRGDVVTTGGTDIGCVTEHLLERRIRRAVIVTDGWVGRVPDAHRGPLRRPRIAAVITAGGERSFADQLGARTFVLPSLS